MAVCNEITGLSQLERSSFAPAPSSFLLRGKQRRLCFASPALVSMEQTRRRRRSCRSTKVVAAISEDVVNLVVGKPEPVKFTVRAAVTVRRKSKEDVKEAIANHLDALADKIGRNVVLELISTEINPSKLLFFYFLGFSPHQIIFFFFLFSCFFDR